MNSDILFAIGFLIIAIVSYYVWTKHGNKDYLWWSLLSLTASTANVFGYIIVILDPSPEAVSLVKKSLTLIVDMVVIISVIIWFKSVKMKNKK
jgi:hypothetical protein